MIAAKGPGHVSKFVRGLGGISSQSQHSHGCHEAWVAEREFTARLPSEGYLALGLGQVVDSRWLAESVVKMADDGELPRAA
jgi:hypothetical protein